MNLDDLLLSVQKPARYIGGEWNSIRKEWAGDKVKFLLAFPDVYEVGMSHLGLKILYGILNRRADCLCERAFSPWRDFEDALRVNEIKLFSLESRRPIREFDIIGFSLAHELGYTNLLNMLDLGGIPKRAAEREAAGPLVIAGGPSSYNPEPIAEFIDAFLIGDGEEAIEEIVEIYKASKNKSRDKLLRELARIGGVYVPSLYDLKYHSDGTIKCFAPLDETIPAEIKKRSVNDLDNSFYPTRQIVPYIGTVHDRITLEIMRGCKHACRFCQATTIYMPCRERTVERILELAEESYRATGYDEISLLSLSSGDHSRIIDIIKGLNEIFKDRAVSISVPSLRVEATLKDLPILISQVKKTGLTFAPEVGNSLLRKAINKNIDIEKLFLAAEESFKHGWRKIKLYFMIGLPGEREEDILAIAKMMNDISNMKKDIDGQAAYVTASVNAFVPKPHTAFQWEAMEGIEKLRERQAMLKANVKSRKIELDFHSFEMGYIEAALSRGDRRLSEVIYDVWSSGGRFDSWQNLFNFDRWIDSFRKARLDPDFYAARKRAHDEILPWDFIETGLSKEGLLRSAPSRLGE